MTVQLSKIIVVICFLVGALFGAELGIEIKGGVSLSKCYYDEDPSLPGWEFTSKPLVSFTGGVGLPIRFTEIFTFQPEINFSQTGWRYHSKGSMESIETNTPDEFDLEGSVMFSYIDLPLLLSVSIPTEKRITPNFYFGPSVGYLLSIKNKETGTYNGESVDTSTTTDTEGIELKESYEQLAYNFIVGGGVTIQLPVGYLITEIRYSGGLKSVDPKSESMKHSGVHLLLGYGFDFNKD